MRQPKKARLDEILDRRSAPILEDTVRGLRRAELPRDGDFDAAIARERVERLLVAVTRAVSVGRADPVLDQVDRLARQIRTHADLDSLLDAINVLEGELWRHVLIETEAGTDALRSLVLLRRILNPVKDLLAHRCLCPVESVLERSLGVAWQVAGASEKDA